MTRLSKIALSLAITAFWIAMMRSIYVREIGGRIHPGGPVIKESVELDSWSEYATASFMGQDLGVISTQIRKQDDGGYVLEHRSLVSQNIMNRRIKAALAGVARFTDELGLEGFYFTTRINGRRIDLKGDVTEEQLTLNIDSEYGDNQQVLHLDSPLQLEMGLTPFLVRRPDFKIGQRFGFSAFNPLSMNAEEGSIEVVESDREDADFLLITRFGENTLSNWITAEGESIAQTSNLGFDAYGITRESLLSKDEASEVDLYISAPIPAELEEGPLQSITLKFMNLKTEDLPIADDRQISRTTLGEFTFLHGNKPSGLEIPPVDLAIYQSLQDAPGQLAGLSATIPEHIKLPWDKAVWLMKWIREHIDVVPTLGAETAYDAWIFHRGDARSITRLFAAMARVTGIPARCVSGLIYQKGGYTCHYWVEIWAGGWVALDPAMNKDRIGPEYVAFRKSYDINETAMRGIIRSARIEIVNQEKGDDKDRGTQQTL